MHLPNRNGSGPRKLFAEERRLIERGLMAAPVDPVPDAERHEILAAIAALQDSVDALHRRLDAGPDARRETPARPDAQPAAELASESPLPIEPVRIEIARMVRTIGQAKREIAAIKHPMAETNRVEAASSELDAIVRATEEATSRILECGESIMKRAKEIATYASDDPDLVAKVDHIESDLTAIFEACNFQDITGQRITKVVKTLRFIEERIISLIGIWGVEAFLDLPIEEDARSEDEKLLEGPQLDNQGLSQADIDALFD